MERSNKVTNLKPQNEVIEVKPKTKNEPQNCTKTPTSSEKSTQKETRENKHPSEISKTSKSNNSTELGVVTCVKIAAWYAKAYGATHVDTNE